MELVMYSFEPALIDVGVNLRRGYIRVAQQFLYDAEIRAIA